jgi:hypothetical protein
LTNTELVGLSSGKISLTSLFRDDFEIPRLPYTSISFGNWSLGSYTGSGFNPIPTGTILVRNDGGAYLFGTSAFQYKTLEFRAKFTAHNFQHLGFTDNLDFNQYIIFSTMSNGQVNTRINSGSGELNKSLGSSYLDDYHLYKIVWSASSVNFYIDDQLMDSYDSNIPTINLRPIISNNDTSLGSNLTIDWVNIPDYPPTGYYQTCSYSSGVNNATWQSINYSSSTTPDSNVTVKFRTSNDNSIWSDWVTESNGQDSLSPIGRFIQFLFDFTNNDNTTSMINSLNFSYVTPTPIPISTPTATPTSSPQNSPVSPASDSFSSPPPICTDSKPASVPDLFQIDINNFSAKLFFTPVSHTSSYFISFSSQPSAQEHSANITLAHEGVQSYTVYFLKPATTYYFKVRGQNGCMPGVWSNILKTNTTKKYHSSTFKTFKNYTTKPTLTAIKDTIIPSPILTTPTPYVHLFTTPPQPTTTPFLPLLSLWQNILQFFSKK